jgi:bifunctional N-acetylglucosamine-1-phosphate-uridyltransferase/glucosamine-1-phosphate-acetyltransferase GlmU-like protein
MIMKHEKYISDLSTYKNVVFHSKTNVYITSNVKISEGTIIEPNVIISDNSVIGKNCKIFSGAIIINSKIGDNCIIGQHTLLRDNVVLKNNVIIGPHSEISRSTFENNSGAFHKCLIIDAHIYENVKLGGGVSTANTKHDGIARKTIIKKNAKVGINVSLVAPITIGANS